MGFFHFQVQKIRNNIQSVVKTEEPSSTDLPLQQQPQQEQPSDTSSKEAESNVEVPTSVDKTIPTEISNIEKREVDSTIPVRSVEDETIEEGDDGYVSDVESDGEHDYQSSFSDEEEDSQNEKKTEFIQSSFSEHTFKEETSERNENAESSYSRQESTKSSEEKTSDDEDIGTLFKAATDLLKDWSTKIGRNDWSSINKNDVNEILEKLKSLNVNNILPPEAIDQFSVLSTMLQDKGRELKELFEKTGFNDGEKEVESFPQKLAGKFAKTLTGTLRRLSDILSDDISDKVEWERRVHNLRENMERKWNGLKSNFQGFFRREKKEELKKEENKPRFKLF
jgi:hypothetical protein